MIQSDKNFLPKLVARMLVFYFSFYLIFSPVFPLIEILKAAEIGYDFKVSNLNLPESVEPGMQLDLPLTIENINTNRWFNDEIAGKPVTQISYKLTSQTDPATIINGEKTALLAEVSDVSFTPNNKTDVNQKIKIIVPSVEDNYSLEIFLYNATSDLYMGAADANKVIYTLNVRVPLKADVTKPIGAIEILKQVQDNKAQDEITSTGINLKLTANDQIVQGEITSGISQYIVSNNIDFTGSDWKAWNAQGEMNISEEIPSIVSVYQYFVKFKDAAGNESHVYTDSIKFVSTIPIGSIEIDKDEQVDVDGSQQVQDKNLKIKLNASSNVNVVQYAISEGTDFSNVPWVNIQDPGIVFETILEKTISDVSGNYIFYVQYKNSENQLSEIYSSTIKYQKYDILPSLEVTTNDVLFGGEMELSAKLENKGEDIGYNARFEIVLPKGFTFIEPLEYKENKTKLSTGGMAPTFISINEKGNQVLVYEGVDDLLKNEITTIHAKLKVGGLNEGYKLGDKVALDVKGQLFKRSNFKTGFEVTASTEVELKPFIVKLEPSQPETNPEDTTSTPASEQLVGDIVDNTITIETNPEIATDAPTTESPNPLVVEFELENGVSYVDGSAQVTINGIVVQVIVQVVKMLNSNPVLKWIFGNIDPNSVINIISVQRKKGISLE